MKKILLLFLFTSFLFSNLYGKGFKLLHVIDIDERLYGSKKPIDEKINIVSKLIKTTSNFYNLHNIKSQSDISNYSKKFHFFDFDNDGLEDILFNGNPNLESDFVIIFQNTGSNYKKVFSAAGNIISFQIDGTTRIVTFRIFHPSCCGGHLYYYDDFALITEGNKFNVIPSKSYAIHEYLKFPERYLEKNIFFVTQNTKYYLRYSPIIDNETMDDRGVLAVDKGNVITVYPKNSVGYAISEKMDETGRIWWLVIMKNNLKAYPSAIYEGHNIKNFHSVGWMSSRYLKTLNKY